MYKKTQTAMQSRAVRAAINAPTNGGIAASDAFRGAPNDLQIERQSLVTRLHAVQSALSALNDRRGYHGALEQMRALGIHAQQRDTQKELRKRLTDEVKIIQLRIMELKPLVRRINIEQANNQRKDVNEIFRRLACQMLAEDVYQRILVAALHQAGEI